MKLFSKLQSWWERRQAEKQETRAQTKPTGKAGTGISGANRQRLLAKMSPGYRASVLAREAWLKLRQEFRAGGFLCKAHARAAQSRMDRAWDAVEATDLVIARRTA